MVFGRKPEAPNTVETRPTLRALAISDARPEWGSRTLPEVVAQKAVDVVITVGDLHRSDIAGADRLSVPVIGVYGNHCDGRYLEDLGATNLHLSRAEVGGLTFAGVQGCVRYKDGSKDLLYTQSEYAEMIGGLPPADVLVTHCPPAGVNDHRGDPAHVGIDALRRWVDSTAPRLVIHGHTYPKPALRGMAPHASSTCTVPACSPSSSGPPAAHPRAHCLTFQHLPPPHPAQGWGGGR